MSISKLCAFSVALSLALAYIVNPVLLAQEAVQTQKTDAAQDEGFESLFDGESLDGWSGAEGFWSIEDEALTGRTTADNPTKGNTFLIWDGELENFELRLKFRIIDGNSGVQFRSNDLGDHRVSGYQADIDSKNTYMGILFEEKGRGILCKRTKQVTINEQGEKSDTGEVCDDAEFLKAVKQEDWNDYVIVANKNEISLTINGITTAKVTDNQTEKAAKTGILALQLHAGPPMTVQFKDIELKVIED